LDRFYGGLIVFESCESFCKDNNLPSIPKEQGEFLAFICQLLKPKVIVEVGTCVGYSALWMANALPESKLITCEQNPENAEKAKEFFSLYNMNNIILLEGNALQTLPRIKDNVQLLFLDATKKEYLNYFKLLKPNLDEGSIIIADNCLTFPEKLKEYVDYMRKHYKSILIPYVNGLEVTLI